MIGENEAVGGFGYKVDRRGGRERVTLFFVAGDQVDAPGAGPDLRELRVVEKDGRRVGKERAVPEAIDAAVEDVDLLAGVEADGGGVGVFTVHEDFVAGLEKRLEGGGELLGAKDWVENTERDVGALDEHDHHRGERPVRKLNLAAAAEKPVEQRAEEKGQRGTDERATEEAHRVASEIEHMAERQGVKIGIFVE